MYWASLKTAELNPENFELIIFFIKMNKKLPYSLWTDENCYWIQSFHYKWNFVFYTSASVSASEFLKGQTCRRVSVQKKTESAQKFGFWDANL